LTGQSTKEDLVTKSGLRRIFFEKSRLPRILFHTKSGLRCKIFIKPFFFIIRRCVSFEVLYSVYQFISGVNDLNSNTEWSQRHNWYETAIPKVSDKRPFVNSNLLRYKSHNTISIPKQFCRWVPNALRPLPRPRTPASQYLSQNKTIQWLLSPSWLLSESVSCCNCLVSMHSAEYKIVHVRFGVDFNRNRFWEKRFRWPNPSLGRRNRHGGIIWVSAGVTNHLMLVLHHYEHLFLFSMLILHVTCRSYLLNFNHFTYTFSHAHIEAHAHKHTCTISRQEEWRQPGTGALLRGADTRLC